MSSKTLTAVFGDQQKAAQARDALISGGVDAGDITLSATMTDDPIAAEWPGQAYENQETRFGAGLIEAVKSGLSTLRNESTRDAERMAEIQRGSVVLSVTAADEGAARATLERCGALSVS